jgi:signal transduction histidine kinase
MNARRLFLNAIANARRIHAAGANRWGSLVSSTVVFVGIVQVLFGWWAVLASLCAMIPTIVLMALVDQNARAPAFAHWLASDPRRRPALLALSALITCSSALLAALFGSINGAEYAVVLANGTPAILCLWFRGDERDRLFALSPYAMTYIAILCLSIFQSNFHDVAVTAGASLFITTVVVGIARSFASETSALAQERLHQIKDHSAAESENRMAAQRLELALAIADACVYEIRPLEQRLIRGDALERIYGRGLTWADFVDRAALAVPADYAVAQAHFLEALAAPSAFQIEYRIETVANEIKWVQCTARSFAGECGRVDRVLVMLADISQRKTVESEFKETFQRATNSLRAKHDLIAAIEAELLGEHARSANPPQAERTIDANATFAEMSRDLSELTKESEARDAALAEAVNALRDARAAADAANAAKSQFLANMSHELRTPLNAVIGYSEIIIEDLAGMGAAKLEPDLQRIRRSAEHLLSLINSVLNFSKVDAGHLDLEIGPCDTAALVDEVIETLHPTADKKGLGLFMEVVSAPVIETDGMRLRQCLLNLLSNACKFTTDGSVRLRVETLDKGERVAFQVIDTGIGISPGQAARLFEPFAQADASITRRFGGTGLGLAITRRFARALGGDITLDSEFGRGSRFTLTVASKLKQNDINHLNELVKDEPTHRVA